ncbi:MAG TPA: hypothetical protein VK432_11165 [Stellaceae bacterium]|nr:hypothetical protein [Stellaceae bacterium]
MPRKAGRRFAIAAFVALLCLLCAAAPDPAQSRPWKPTPAALAQDYTQIIDNRSGKELVLVWWLVPQLIPNSSAAAELLDKYVVVGIIHGHVDVGGTLSFDKIDSLQAMDGNSTPLKALIGDNIPPAVQGALTAVEGVLRQALGPTGQGIAWFVFEGGAVHACQKGGLSIPFEGETYTYETPIPGCPKT